MNPVIPNTQLYSGNKGKMRNNQLEIANKKCFENKLGTNSSLFLIQ